MKKKLLRILGSVIVVGALAYAFFTAWRPQPIRVETARVTRGPLRVTIDAEGKTRVRDRFTVAAPITGKLIRMPWRRGDAINRHQIVARIEPLPLAPLDPRQLAEAQARVATAEQLRNEAAAGVAQVRAQCEQAQRELERATRLVETGDIAKQDFERARNAATTCAQQLDAATHRERAAAAEVEVAQAALLAVTRAGKSDTSAAVVVRAPVRGNVLRVLEESERVIVAGTPLLELSDGKLEIVIDVLSSDAVNIAPGAVVLIEGWGGAQQLAARVRKIEPAGFTKVSALGIEEQRVNVIADFADQAPPLGDGYRLEARIVIWESTQTLKAPLSAFFRQGENWHVFIAEKGFARLRQVKTGHRTANEMEIMDNLKEGDSVIPHPSNLLTDGAAITATPP